MKERKFTLDEATTRPIRKEFGRQTQIADALNVHLSLLSRYLTGKRYIPESHLAKLCRLTGKVPSDYLKDAADKQIADSAFFA